MPRKKISIWGGLFMLVGFVVGASVYVLPGALYQEAGPAFVLSFGLGAIPALLACLIAAQIGVAYPAAGANTVGADDVLGEPWGFVTGWLIIISSIVALALLAHGFASYVQALAPKLGASSAGIGGALIATCLLLNLVGITTAVTIQSVLVVVKLAILFAVAAAMLMQFDTAKFTPFAPNGAMGVALAIVPAFFAFLGFTLIVEIADDLNDPARSLPRVLAGGFVIVTLIYLGVVVGTIGVLSPTELNGHPAALDLAARRVLPAPVAAVVTLSALLAAGTSLNGLLFVVSRDVLALARAGSLPRMLASTAKDGSPRAALVAVAIVAALVTALGAGVSAYATLTVVAFMGVQALMAIVAIGIPARLGPGYPQLAFHMPIPVLRLVCVLTFVSAVAFAVLSAIDDVRPLALTIGLVAAGLAVRRLFRGAI